MHAWIKSIASLCRFRPPAASSCGRRRGSASQVKKNASHPPNMKKPTKNGPASDDDAKADANASTSTAKDQRNIANDPKKKTGKKTLWVTIFKCFHCGKHGHNLPKCRQCEQAFYCNADCQRKHWKKHKRVCRAAVAALARRAHRERLARAVREKGKDKVKGAEEDELCVICLSKPVDPVEVSLGSLFF